MFYLSKMSRKFCELYQLQDHIRKHEQLDVKEINKKAFISNDKLLVENADNICDYCGKKDKPYQCQYCGKGYKQSFNLQTHLRIHTGDKHYQCWKKISL